MNKKIFHTTQSDLLKYDGECVEVLGELDESKYDKEDVGLMFVVRTSNGTELQAFEDELSDIEPKADISRVEFFPISESDRKQMNNTSALDDRTKVIVYDSEGHVGHTFVENREIELFGQEYIRSHVSLVYSEPLRDWFVQIDRDSYLNDLNFNPIRPIRLEFVEIEHGTGREVYRGLVNRNYYLREVHPEQNFAEWAVCGKRKKADDGVAPRANTVFIYGNQTEQVKSWGGKIAAWEDTFNKSFSQGIYAE